MVVRYVILLLKFDVTGMRYVVRVYVFPSGVAVLHTYMYIRYSNGIQKNKNAHVHINVIRECTENNI